ncbi:MAG: hypothetical protein ACRCX8_12840 [Sarcina sp.]
MVKDIIDGFTRKEDLIEFLINPVNFYSSPTKEPSGLALNKVSDSERIILSEYAYMPFKGKVEVDGVFYPVRTLKKLCIYPTYIRKNQQIANKEAKSANSDNNTNILGQAAGGDKVGTFSDAEWTVCLQHNLYNITKELNGPASHDLAQKKVYRSTMMNLGEVSLKDLPENVENKRSIVYLDQTLKMMGIDTDLIKFPE